MQDLIAGRVDYMCNATSITVEQVKAGTLKPIALLSLRRNPALPKIATAGEQGLKDFDADSWGPCSYRRVRPPRLCSALLIKSIRVHSMGERRACYSPRNCSSNSAFFAISCLCIALACASVAIISIWINSYDWHARSARSMTSSIS